MLVIGATGILAPAAAALEARGDRVVAVSRGGGAGRVAHEPRRIAATAQAPGDSVRTSRESAEFVHVDARDAGELAAALAAHAWDDAIVYAPAVSEASLGFVRSVTPGRCVLVRVSRSADPARGNLIIPRDTLQLGWRPSGDPAASTRAERQGSAQPAAPAETAAADRWHTPDEVSAAALEVLRDGEPRVLGVVRPWSDKP